MALRLLQDECASATLLNQKLKSAGPDVQTVAETVPPLTGKPDRLVFQYAIAEKRIVLTFNCADFVELATKVVSNGGNHPGVLLIYQFHEHDKDMNYDEIERAIRNLVATEVALENTCHKLNDYNY